MTVRPYRFCHARDAPRSRGKALPRASTRWAALAMTAFAGRSDSPLHLAPPGPGPYTGAWFWRLVLGLIPAPGDLPAFPASFDPPAFVVGLRVVCPTLPVEVALQTAHRFGLRSAFWTDGLQQRVLLRDHGDGVGAQIPSHDPLAKPVLRLLTRGPCADQLGGWAAGQVGSWAAGQLGLKARPFPEFAAYETPVLVTGLANPGASPASSFSGGCRATPVPSTRPARSPHQRIPLLFVLPSSASRW